MLCLRVCASGVCPLLVLSPFQNVWAQNGSLSRNTQQVVTMSISYLHNWLPANLWWRRLNPFWGFVILLKLVTASTLAGPPEVVIMLIIHQFYRRIQGFIDLVQLLGLGNTEHKKQLFWALSKQCWLAGCTATGLVRRKCVFSMIHTTTINTVSYWDEYILPPYAFMAWTRKCAYTGMAPCGAFAWNKCRCILLAARYFSA